MLPEALALNFARHFSNRKRSASTKNLGFSHYDTCIFSGCTSIILLDLKESECAEAVNELTGFAVGEVLLLLTSNFKFSSIFFQRNVVSIQTSSDSQGSNVMFRLKNRSKPHSRLL